MSEVLFISLLSILVTSGWWAIGVWGLTLNAGIFTLIFVFDGLMTILLLKYFERKITK